MPKAITALDDDAEGRATFQDLEVADNKNTSYFLLIALNVLSPLAAGAFIIID